MLRINNIKKEYRTAGLVQKALDGVSMDLRNSEFVAVLGPSGSGKTTLLNVIGGLDHADSGEIEINGISTAKYRDRDWDTYRNHTIGFVFQSYNLIPHQTVLSNVELALTISGISKKERRERAKRVLDEVGLTEHIHKLPNQLSGGQMQRVAIARALVNDPDILLADEPTGALDSETGIQVMELLKKVSNDRLVVMVTHNPDLANEYATRIIRLKDGKVIADSDPYNAVSDVPEKTGGNVKKASMSFLTALSLSFNNLMTKKARTILVAFAGSIGIIGIALILSLSNGVNKYIDDVEEETLSEYPVQIQSTGFDLTSLIQTQEGSSGLGGESENNAGGSTSGGAEDEMAEGEIGEMRTATELLSNSSTNDLESFKEFLDGDESDIREYATTIEYKYNVTPIIYRVDGESKYARKVNPDETFAAAGIGGSSSTSSSLMSMAMSTDSFFDMPEDEKTYRGQYDVKAGRWPESDHELVLVLSGNGNVTDLVLYMLGKKDPGELPDAISKFVAGDEVELKDEEHRFTYDELIGEKFKLVINSDMYTYDSSQEVYIDRSGNKRFMDKLAKKGEDLEIVGIVQPKKDAKALSLQLGIGYMPGLVKHVIDENKDSDIVKAQLKHPGINPLTGKRFGEDDEGEDFDLQKLITVDEQMLKSAFSFDTGRLTLDPNSLAGRDLTNVDMSGLENAMQPRITDDTMNELFNELATDYQKTLKKNNSSDPNGLAESFAKYLTTDEAKGIMASVPQDATDEQNQMMMVMLYQGYDQYAKKNGLSNQDDISSGFSRYMNSSSAKNIINKKMESMADTGEIEKEMTRTIEQTVSSYMKAAMDQLASGLEDAMTVDPTAFANAINVNMDAEDLESMLMQMATRESASYEGNMKNFGYADLKDPSMILIYPKDFSSKDEVTGIIDSYNERMKKANQDDKVITYSDIVGTLMSSVTDIINQISMVLIAFVAISLIVSSIMIGVITYISVLERKKEIGILRAMGASKGNVANVFNAETFIIGLMAGVLGIVISLVLLIPGNQIIKTLADGTEMRARMPMQAALVLIALSVVLTLIGGWIPSRKAAKSDPVTALRTE